MSYTVGTLYSGIEDLLVGRILQTSKMAEHIRKGVLELSENYKFEGLQTSGPIVQTVTNQNKYAPGFFLSPADAGLDIKKFNSFWLYIDPSSPPVLTNLSPNAGYNLSFRTINDVEVLLNVPGLPIYWTRHEGNIYFGSCPDNSYYMYARYQKQHPFPNAGTPSAGNDPVLLPDSWQDICEYMGAMRYARTLNLANKSEELHTALYGDSKFQQTNGLEGSPGLIFQRTSQEYRDQTTSVKSFRPRMRSV